MSPAQREHLQRWLRRLSRHRLWAGETLQAVAAAAALALSSATGPGPAAPPQLWPLLAGLQLSIFRAFRLHRRSWRLWGAGDLLAIAAASLAGAFAASLAASLAGGEGLPPAFLMRDAAFLFVALAGLRIAVRAALDALPPGEASRPVLIYGAGRAGAALLRTIRAHPACAWRVAGFLDDDPAKRGRLLEGLRVLGGGAAAAAAAAETGAREVLIAMPGAGASALAAALERCRAAGLAGRVVPRPELQVPGAPPESAFEPAALLLRRPAAVGGAAPRWQIENRVVLVTGAAGSIGSELCRQLARCGPARLVAFDHSESGLFELGEELGGALTPVVGDVRDRAAVQAALARHRPEVVFHAAALKHVPLLEEHPFEALATNAVASARLAEACHRHRVERFVLVSTDKAVAPASVMGASKQLAERLCLALGGPARIVAVRFGNVLGSRGSVVPAFRRQIRSGGPLRITHPDMRRYLMTIPEAAHLLLYAAYAGAPRDVLVLEMGEPVRILDLAHRLLALAGLEPGRDVPIAFTGLRPGEKLHEELFAPGETRSPAGHPLVWRVRGEHWPARRAIQVLNRLERLLAERDAVALARFWEDVLPDFWLTRQSVGGGLPHGEVAHRYSRGDAGRDPVEAGEELGVPGAPAEDEAFHAQQRGGEAELDGDRPGAESLPAGREQRV